MTGITGYRNSREHSFTADDNVKMFTTEKLCTKISVIVKANADVGGGTLTLQAKPADSTADPEVIDTLSAGSQYTYEIGGLMDIYLDLDSSTSPDATVFISEVLGG